MLILFIIMYYATNDYLITDRRPDLELVGWLVGWILWYINLCKIFNAQIYFYTNKSKSKVGDHSQGRTEGSLFNSYNTEV